ncbi:MAG: Trm112 family protein [Candidatus Eisenbacteria sp.]|nr:Trm112 family protein [Candidatus Eisenbacteria bacterium]
MALSTDLLEILVCPVCKGDLEYLREQERLVCHACRLAYRIEEDIPIMLPDEAESLGGEPSADQAGSGEESGK